MVRRQGKLGPTRLRQSSLRIGATTRRQHQQASKSKSVLAAARGAAGKIDPHKMTSLTIAAFLTSAIPKCLGAETSLEGKLPLYSHLVIASEALNVG